MNLYEIDAQILACVDEETGEIDDFEQFEKLQLDRDAKIENIILLIKNLSAYAEACKNEKQVFEAKQKAATDRKDRLKAFLQEYLNGESFKTTRASVSYRKTTHVEVADAARLPKEYTRVTIEADKTALKGALKQGVEIEGAELVAGVSMIIK
jgi:hypothetical protein